MAPNVTRCVTVAIAPSTTQGSKTSPRSTEMSSQANTPSQPLSSASRAIST